ncbi:hypothetical protein LINGRAPRIM_LOCUS1086 [Linum grandiflorum]
MTEILLLKSLQLTWSPVLLPALRCVGLSKVYSLYGDWEFENLGSTRIIRRPCLFCQMLLILTTIMQFLLCNFRIFATSLGKLRFHILIVKLIVLESMWLT